MQDLGRRPFLRGTLTLMNSLPTFRSLSLKSSTEMTVEVFIACENELDVFWPCQTVVLSVADNTHPTVTPQWTPLTVSDVTGSARSDQTATETTARRFSVQIQGVVSRFWLCGHKGNHDVAYVLL